MLVMICILLEAVMELKVVTPLEDTILKPELVNGKLLKNNLF